MQNVIQEVHMKELTRRATLALALSASATSLVSAWFVPFGHVWPSAVLAVVGCAAGLWAMRVMTSPPQRMGDVIAGVEAELPAAVLAPAPGLVRRGARS